jgi:hypothetical protein
VVFLTPKGIYIAVRNAGLRGVSPRITIGATSEQELTDLRSAFMPSLGPTEKMDGTFVATIPHEAFVEGMQKIAQAVTYESFKKAAAQQGGEARGVFYGEVLATLKEAKSRIAKEQKHLDYEADMRRRQRSLPFDKPRKK